MLPSRAVANPRLCVNLYTALPICAVAVDKGIHSTDRAYISEILTSIATVVSPSRTQVVLENIGVTSALRRIPMKLTVIVSYLSRR